MKSDGLVIKFRVRIFRGKLKRKSFVNRQNMTLKNKVLTKWHTSVLWLGALKGQGRDAYLRHPSFCAIRISTSITKQTYGSRIETILSWKSEGNNLNLVRTEYYVK